MKNNNLKWPTKFESNQNAKLIVVQSMSELCHTTTCSYASLCKYLELVRSRSNTISRNSWAFNYNSFQFSATLPFTFVACKYQCIVEETLSRKNGATVHKNGNKCASLLQQNEKREKFLHLQQVCVCWGKPIVCCSKLPILNCKWGFTRAKFTTMKYQFTVDGAKGSISRHMRGENGTHDFMGW